MSSAADLKHDTPLAALAMFGAIALGVGVPQQFLPPYDAISIAGSSVLAAFAAALVGAVERDVSRIETAIAAFLATMACASVDWRTGHLADRSLEEISIPAAASAVVAAVWGRLPGIATSRAGRIAFALFISAAILAALVLGGLALHRATGWSLTPLPWIGGAASGAFLAWRVPWLSRTDACIGIFLSMLVAGVGLVPAAPGELPPGGIMLIVVIASTMMAGVGGYLHHRVALRLAKRSLPTARARDRA